MRSLEINLPEPLEQAIFWAYPTSMPGASLSMTGKASVGEVEFPYQSP